LLVIYYTVSIDYVGTSNLEFFSYLFSYIFYLFYEIFDFSNYFAALILLYFSMLYILDYSSDFKIKIFI